jgi:hypothetical protein
MASDYGFGRTLVGSEAARALEGLASHYNASAVRALEDVRKHGLFRVAENLQITLIDLVQISDQVQRSLLAPLRASQRAFEQLQLQVQRFAEEQRAIDQQLDAFVLRHGWPVPLNLPTTAYRQIVSMAPKGKREVTASMVHWFRPEGRIFRDCASALLNAPALESRMPLIRQVLRAHRRRDHYLVINGLLPLVEGVLVDRVFEGETPPATSGTQKAVRRLAKELDSPLAMGGAVRAIERLVVSGAAGMGLFTQTSRADYGGSGEPRSLNRHAILHGYARRYGGEANGLRMILLLNVIVQVIG